MVCGEQVTGPNGNRRKGDDEFGEDITRLSQPGVAEGGFPDRSSHLLPANPFLK